MKRMPFRQIKKVNVSMRKIVINGGKTLKGSVTVSGAKTQLLLLFRPLFLQTGLLLWTEYLQSRM